MTAEQLKIKLVAYIINPLMTLLLAVAVLVFIVGIAKFIRDLSSGVDPKEGKSLMIWGLIGFVIITSAIAIENSAIATFNSIFTSTL